MGRFALLLVICALGAGALYVWQRRRADQENVPVATVAASRPVVTNSGCTAQQSVFFDLHSAEVGSPITGKIGRHRACEGSDIDHMSGEDVPSPQSTSPLIWSMSLPSQALYRPILPVMGPPTSAD